MEENTAKKRAPNFSVNDCVLLAEIMGRACTKNTSLTNYAYVRHKFTIHITTSTKKGVWEDIVSQFNRSAEYIREKSEVYKKWDNLVQKHRAIYADYQHGIRATGGGPSSRQLSVLTEAVMDVVGRESANVVGIGDDNLLDTSALALHKKKSCTEQTNTETDTNNTETDNNNNDPLLQTPLKHQRLGNPRNTPPETVSNKRCHECDCQYHREVRAKKLRKLDLEIQLLEGRVKAQNSGWTVMDPLNISFET